MENAECRSSNQATRRLPPQFRGARRVKVEGLQAGSSRLQLAHMADVPLTDGTQIGCCDGRHRHGSAGKRDEFDLVSRAFLMDMHDRADVAGFETFFRQMLRQDYAIMFFDSHLQIDNLRSSLAQPML